MSVTHRNVFKIVLILSKTFDDIDFAQNGQGVNNFIKPKISDFFPSRLSSVILPKCYFSCMLDM